MSHGQPISYEYVTPDNSEDDDRQVDIIKNIHALLADDMKSVNALIIKYMESQVDMIPRIASYLITAGGKRFRPLLTLASTRIFDGNMERAHLLATAVEFIHTATLLHDDVVDESLERRGQESSNIVFGNQASVLVGDFLFSRAFQLMVRDGNLRVLKILSDASAIIAQGEVLQLSFKGNVDVTFDDYLAVITSKTAALFSAACEMGPVIAESGESAIQAMAEFGLNFGIAFQMTDDMLDYSGDPKKLGKTVGDDFREGKITAPVIFCLENANAEEKEFWKKTLENGGEANSFLYAQDLIKKHNSLEKTQKKAAEYVEKARLALAEAPDNEIRALLDRLCSTLLNREY